LKDVQLENEDQRAKIEEKVWRMALNTYAKLNSDVIVQQVKEKEIEDNEDNEFEDNEENELNESKRENKFNELAKAARKYLFDILEADLSNLQYLVNELIRGIEKKLKNQAYLQIKPSAKRNKLPPPTVQRELNEKGHRRRQNWSVEEDKILIRAYQEQEQEHAKHKQIWGKICVQLSCRTNIDCKDRWRVLMKKYKSTKAIYDLIVPPQTTVEIVTESIVVPEN
jgi:hypothetical protein